jgi:tetratricopeptide (TPR) repeat protein
MSEARFPLNNVPYSHNPNFTGRAEMLERLHRQLNRAEGRAVISQAITGLGGVGKTQLALEYIYRHEAEYDLIWWLRADGVLNLAADVAGLAVALGEHNPDNPDQQAAINAAHRWLVQTDKRWLLLVDNADELPPRTLLPYLPAGGQGHILITSRRVDWSGFAGQAAVLPLDVFTLSEALAFLLQRLGTVDASEADVAEANALAETLGHFPLALEHVAAYVQRAGSSLAEYRHLFETRWQELWAEAQPPERYHATITTTWEVAFARVRETAGAAELLNLCCFLAPENIPLDLIRNSQKPGFWEKPGFSQKPGFSALADPLLLNKAVAALRDYSLLKREGETIALHRLVQTVARDRMGEERVRQWAEITVDLLAEEWPFDLHDMTTWASCGELLPHLQAACEQANVYGIETNNLAFLNNEIGFYLQHYGNLIAARPYYERALAIWEKVLGPEHPDKALSLNNLGYLLDSMGDSAGARPYYERALAIREKVLGPEHPHTATSLNNLGMLLKAMGDYAGARPYYERALAIQEKVLGPEHPDTALSLNNLGGLLQAMGEYAGARPYYERALAIREKVLGPEHPDTARSLNNLGSLLDSMGDYEGARPYYERALAIWEKVLGPEHPDTATSLNNLGYLLQAMGDTAGARPYFERALAIREKVLGPEHPDTALSLNNLGYLLRAMGDHAGARPYFERALAIREKVLGPEHPDTASSLNNLAILCYYQGDYQEAARLMRRALAIREQRLGPQHPNTLSSRQSLAAIEAKL